MPEAHSLLQTALFDAVVSGNLEKIQSILAVGAEQDIGEGSALHWAAYHGHLNVVQWLVEQAAVSVNQQNDECAVLHWAVTGGCLPVVQWLVEKAGAITDQQSKECSALHSAANEGHLEILRYLGVKYPLSAWELKNNDQKKPFDLLWPEHRIAMKQHLEAISNERFLFFALGRQKRVGQGSAVRVPVDDMMGLIHEEILKADVEAFKLG